MLGRNWLCPCLLPPSWPTQHPSRTCISLTPSISAFLGVKMACVFFGILTGECDNVRTMLAYWYKTYMPYLICLEFCCRLTDFYYHGVFIFSAFLLLFIPMNCFMLHGCFDLAVLKDGYQCCYAISNCVYFLLHPDYHMFGASAGVVWRCPCLPWVRLLGTGPPSHP